jgi:hypothetical protein
VRPVMPWRVMGVVFDVMRLCSRSRRHDQRGERGEDEKQLRVRREAPTDLPGTCERCSHHQRMCVVTGGVPVCALWPATITRDASTNTRTASATSPITSPITG